MILIPFTVDARPHHGYQTVYISPEEVSSVHDSGDVDNPSYIKMKNGGHFIVMGYPEDNANKLQGIETL